jgi:ERCC4-type nuclease
MIWVDAAVGSNELVKPLVKLGYPAEKTSLKFGDIAFTGLGEGGVDTEVGIEFKKLSELVEALRSGRFVGHQLPGLQSTFDHAWLCIEGTWQHDDQGQIATYQGRGRGWRPLHGRMSAGELDKQLLTIEMLGGIHVHTTASRRDTLRWLGSLYRWWTDTALDRHSSHRTIYRPKPLVPVSQFRQTVATLPGIGYRTSAAVEDAFYGNLRLAIGASVEEWAEITTVDDNGKARRIGEKDATRIVNAIREGPNAKKRKGTRS